MRITIHQPEYMPWLGFFHKINMADVYVVLDDVQFSKNYFQNRNKVRTPDGWTWVALPVNRNIKTLIKDVTIANDSRWQKKWHGTIYYNYKKTPYFDCYFEGLSKIINEEWKQLSDLNIALIEFFLKALNIQKEIKFASMLNVSGEKADLIFNICKATDAKTYISGVSGKEYLDLKKFQEAGIDVEFQEFHHPIYKQLQEPFIPCMSVIDLLFNYGEKSLDVINGIGVPVMEEVFL